MNKYKFSELVGNTVTLNLLRRSLANNTFRQFSIFCGPYGTGKSTSAKIASMALTCLNPTDGQPCLTCSSCKNNMRAFESTGESTNVKIINIGELNSKADVSELIKNVFVLQASSNNSVYIFEEAHALKSLCSAQTALLEELDRMPPNTYVIMCTTNPNDLLEALRSRAIKFQFNRLNHAEAKMLLHLTAEKLGILHVSTDIEKLILSESKGVPRNIINSIDFIISNNVSKEEYREFIRDVSAETFIMLFQAASAGNLVSMYEQLEQLCATREPKDIVLHLKDFLVSVLFCIEGGITEEFDNIEVNSIREIFDSSKLQKISLLLEKLNFGSSDADVKLFFYKLSLILQERDTKKVFSQNSAVASEENVKAKLSAIEHNNKSKDNQTVQLHKLRVSSLTSFGGGKNESPN